MSDEPIPFGKYYSAFKIGCHVHEGTVNLSVECSWFGPTTFKGTTLAECIAKALEHYFDHEAAPDPVDPFDRIRELEAERDSLLSGHRALNVGGARLQDRAERAEAELTALRAAAEGMAGALEGWTTVAEHCSISDGVCCCGDSMENHAEPMNCGHSPVDHGAYFTRQVLDATLVALAAYAADKPTTTIPAESNS